MSVPKSELTLTLMANPMSILKTEKGSFFKISKSSLKIAYEYR